MEPRIVWKLPGTSGDESRAAAVFAPKDFTPYTIAIMIAIAANILISATLLLQMGVPYDTLGGLFLLKFHPGTYVAIITLIAYFVNNPDKRAELFNQKGPWYLIYAIGTVLVFQALGPPKTGTASLIENFIPPAAVCLILATATDRCKQATAYMMIGLFSINIVIALCESVVGARLVPSSEAMEEVVGEFRGAGLADHPLTGAAMTMICLFLFLSTKPPIRYMLPMLLLIYAGFLSFSGRTALVLSTVLLVAWGLGVTYSKVKVGRFRIYDGILGLVISVVVPFFFGLMLTGTSVGARLVNHLYWDDSAQTRNIQWKILGMMSLPQLLFGINTDQLTDYIWQLGLLFPFNDVENFWLLMFCTLGGVSFVFFVLGFLSFLWWLWKEATPGGRVLLVGMLLVLTSSNSLGRKSNMLTILAPAVLCTSAFRGRGSEAYTPLIATAPALTTNFWRPFRGTVAPSPGAGATAAPRVINVKAPSLRPLRDSPQGQAGE